MPVDELLRGRVALSLRRHEPVGVVTCITPYNAALMMAFQKIIPALMAGNSVLLRPSPLTPISSLALGAAADAAGLPAGALSVIVEGGSDAAELLTTDPKVDMVSFTGSTAVGRLIAAQAAPTLKRVALELGGKSAQIYLPDAMHRVGMGAAMVVAMTAGQACVSATRMLVPEDRKDEALEAAAGAYAFLTVGPPTAEGTTLGPVISAAAARAVRALRRTGRGARRQGRHRRRPTRRAGQGLLLRAHRPRPARQLEPRRPGRDLRPGARGDRLPRHRPRRPDRQRQQLRAVGPGVRQGRGGGDRHRPAAAHRRGQRQHLGVQRLRPRRRLQAERPRAASGARTASASSKRSSTSPSASSPPDDSTTERRRNDERRNP